MARRHGTTQSHAGRVELTEHLPIIGVIACGREVEGEPAQAVKHRYLEAVLSHSSAVPIIVPTNQTPENAAAVARRLDALLLTGSNSNVSPLRYGVDREAAVPVDDGRDAFGFALIRACVDAARPILGVCRGLQEINVAFGGTLRDLRDDPPAATTHHAPDGASLAAMFGHTHEVSVVSPTPLSDLVGSAVIDVNSVHFQAIERLGSGLQVAARSADGVIEAVYSTSTDAPVLAVQWHPEWQPAKRPFDLALWSYLGSAARRAAATR